MGKVLPLLPLTFSAQTSTGTSRLFEIMSEERTVTTFRAPSNDTAITSRIGNVCVTNDAEILRF